MSRYLSAYSWVVSVLAIGALAAGVLVGGANPASAWRDQQCPVGGKTYVVQPGLTGEELRHMMSGLYRGDTLLLAPGVYNLGKTAVYACHADPANRITITALDPTNPPLLRGWLYFLSPNYWTISHLRVEATLPGQGAMQIAGGTGWVVDGLELFGGAKTAAYGTLALGGDNRTGPRDFAVVNSCIHDGGRMRGDAGLHGIYVSGEGAAGSAGGLIADNVIFNQPGGAGVKIGVGGARGAVGAWNIRVEHNTIFNVGFGVVLHGRLNSESVTRNLMGGFGRASGGGYGGAKRAAIYAHELQGRNNVVAGNYFYKTDMILRLTGKGRPKVSRSNVVGSAPAFVGSGCGVRVAGGRAASFGARH